MVRVGDRTDAGDTFVVTLLGDRDALDVLDEHGVMPLPPYIHTPLADADRYQTVYATRPGSAAAPTAGLHLTDAVFAGLAANGIDVARVELVVGLDTFAPVTEDDPADAPDAQRALRRAGRHLGGGGAGARRRSARRRGRHHHRARPRVGGGDRRPVRPDAACSCTAARLRRWSTC